MMMKFFLRLLFSLVTTPRCCSWNSHCCQYQNLNGFVFKWFCSREHIFFRPFLESTVSTEYFYTLPVWKLFSCEVPISTWPALDRRYQMFAMHRPPWIVDVETDYILGMSRFRRIGYLCGKRNIFVKSLDCWVQFFLWQVNALFIKSPPCGRACFEIATRND